MTKVFHSISLPECDELTLKARALPLMSGIDPHFSQRDLKVMPEQFDNIEDAEDYLEDELYAWGALGAAMVRGVGENDPDTSYCWVVGGWTVDNSEWINRNKANPAS